MRNILFIILINVLLQSCSGCSRSGKIMSNRFGNNQSERNEDIASRDMGEHGESKNKRNRFS